MGGRETETDRERESNDETYKTLRMPHQITAVDKPCTNPRPPSQHFVSLHQVPIFSSYVRILKYFDCAHVEFISTPPPVPSICADTAAVFLTSGYTHSRPLCCFSSLSQWSQCSFGQVGPSCPPRRSKTPTQHPPATIDEQRSTAPRKVCYQFMCMYAQ